jgi:outer membrane protein assembly factor BamB
MRKRGVSAALAIVLALGFGACGGAKKQDPAPRLTGGGPGWLAPNGDLSATRWVNGPIDSASVSRLAFVWRSPLNGVATPLVVGDVVYTQDLASSVYAVDLRSGRLRWKSDFSEAEGSTNGGPNGVAFGDGRLYGATTRLAFALDARTGRRVWTRSVVRGQEGIDMAPGYADGTMVVSTNPGPSTYAGGVRGTVWALDGATGRPRWSWLTVDRDLWGHPELNGGGGLWYTPSFDGRGGVYLPIGNPGPVPGTRRYPWGASRPGPNRWSNSIVKLNVRTGRLLWARQVLPHDLYDWDLECPVILLRAHGRPLAIVGGKMGFVYAFDQNDGTLVWKRSVGIHNGHDRDNLRALRGTDRSRAPRRVFPGVLGGIETPMAADRDTVYVPVVNLWSSYGPEAILTTQGFGEGAGELVALDAATGRVRWDRRLTGSPYGAATVVNDLVFTTTYDGAIWALRTGSGRAAWHKRLPDGTNGPVSVAGDTLLALPNVPFGNNQPIALFAYRLRGG